MKTVSRISSISTGERIPPRAYTYLLQCADNTLYCGWTNNLTARLAAHNAGKGAKYTQHRRPVQLVYSELFGTHSEAMRREAAIKRLPRAQKEQLIQSQTGGELLTIYDAAHRPCGERPRALVHAQGLFHDVCHLWVVGVWDGIAGIWLQQRQFDRPLYPGWFDLTATGHIDPGETPAVAVLREAQEEVGLSLSDETVCLIGTQRQCYVRQPDGGIDDELAYAFLTRIDGIPAFVPGNEVAAMVFVSVTDFARVHEQPIPLPARRLDGTATILPYNRLCCLHPGEWQQIQPAFMSLHL